MATDINWPENLRTAIRNTKTIQRAAGFRESDPAAGASYTEFFTDDQPTFMQFDLKFTQYEKQYFESWVRVNGIFKYGRTFNFPIKDEYGVSFQEVRFIANGIPSSSENGLVKNVSGCQILIADYFKPDEEVVFSFYENYGVENAETEIAALDLAINREWPTV
jgi:hypothetical protein